jgi:hypothetical protein
MAIIIVVVVFVTICAAFAWWYRTYADERRALGNINECGFITYNRLGRVKTLCVYGKHFNDSQIPHVFALRNLKVLMIDHTALTSDGILRLASHPSIHTLAIAQPDFGDVELVQLSNICKASRLEVERLSLSALCVEALAGMRTLESLLLPMHAREWPNVDKLHNDLPNCRVDFARHRATQG